MLLRYPQCPDPVCTRIKEPVSSVFTKRDGGSQPDWQKAYKKPEAVFWGFTLKQGRSSSGVTWQTMTHPFQHPAGGRTPLRTAFMVIFPSLLMPPAFTDALPLGQLSIAHLNQLPEEQIHWFKGFLPFMETNHGVAGGRGTSFGKSFVSEEGDSAYTKHPFVPLTFVLCSWIPYSDRKTGTPWWSSG